MNIKQLRRENDVLKTDKVAMKDEIKQLNTENDMMKAEIIQLKAEISDFKACNVNTDRPIQPPPVPQRKQKLKVSQWQARNHIYSSTY